MANSEIVLPNGTKIKIEGTAEEIAKIISLYNESPNPKVAATASNKRAKVEPKAGERSDENFNIPDLVGVIKDCEEAESIEHKILDQRDVLNRVLLPIYIANKYIDAGIGMTSGDIQKVTDQLGVKVEISNASKILSGRAKAYVAGDAVRKKGAPIRYKMTRRGMQYMDGVLE